MHLHFNLGPVKDPEKTVQWSRACFQLGRGPLFFSVKEYLGTTHFQFVDKISLIYGRVDSRKQSGWKSVFWTVFHTRLHLVKSEDANWCALIRRIFWVSQIFSNTIQWSERFKICHAVSGDTLCFLLSGLPYIYDIQHQFNCISSFVAVCFHIISCSHFRLLT